MLGQMYLLSVRSMRHRERERERRSGRGRVENFVKRFRTVPTANRIRKEKKIIKQEGRIAVSCRKMESERKKFFPNPTESYNNNNKMERKQWKQQHIYYYYHCNKIWNIHLIWFRQNEIFLVQFSWIHWHISIPTKRPPARSFVFAPRFVNLKSEMLRYHKLLFWKIIHWTPQHSFPVYKTRQWWCCHCCSERSVARYLIYVFVVWNREREKKSINLILRI